METAIKRRLDKIEDKIGTGALPEREKVQVIHMPFRDIDNVEGKQSARLDVLKRLRDQYGDFDPEEVLCVFVVGYA